MENNYLEALPLTGEEAAILQSRLWDLLAWQVARYTMGESTSVPRETAQELLEGLLFTLGGGEGDPARLRRLLVGDLREHYRRSRQELEETCRRGERLWRQVWSRRPRLGSVALEDTLSSMGTFWRRYDRDFFPHQIPCDIDYPLCHPVPETLQGAAYVIEYLRRVRLETRVLGRFDQEIVRRVLEGGSPDYRGLLVNLMEPVAVNALGLVLAGKSPYGLDLNQDDRNRLFTLLAGHTGVELENRLSAGAARLCETLGLGSRETGEYLDQLARSLTPRLRAALAAGELRGVFCPLSSS